jgi:hypothetical protein
VLKRAPSQRHTKPDPLEQEIEKAFRPGCFIKYNSGWSFVEGLDRVEDKIANLVASTPARAVSLYEALLAGSYEKIEELDDSSGDFGFFVGRLFLGWVKARQAADADPNETARRMIAWMDNDSYGFCHKIEHDLVKVLNKRGMAAFERCIRERFDGKATAGTGPVSREWDPAYVRRRAAEILRPIHAKQRNVEAYIALCEETYLSADDCLVVAKMLKARRKPVEALAWVERGIAVDKQQPSFSDYDLRLLKRELLLKLGRGDAALEAAWADFKEHPSKYSFADLMRYVPKEERAAWQKKAMDGATGADLGSLIDLWLEIKEIDRLVERLRNVGDEELEGISHYTIEPVARKLAKTHPDVAAKVYRALGMRILKAKKSKYYNAALSSFEQARHCYERAGLAANWEAIVREIRSEHHRKAGFMSGFEEVVAGGGPSARPGFLERAKMRWSISPGK